MLLFWLLLPVWSGLILTLLWMAWKKRNPIRLGIYFASAHFLFTLFALRAELASSYNACYSGAWLLQLLAMVDYPLFAFVAVFINHLPRAFGLPKLDVNYTLTAIMILWAFFATIGSAIYFLIGLGIGKLVNRIARARQKTP